MIYSFSTNAFVRFPLSAAIEKIAACGYEGVEILADVPHLFLDEVMETKIGIVERVLSATGMQVANINANTAVGYYRMPLWEPLFEPSLANPDDKGRRWRISYTKSAIDVAERLSSPTVSITSGRPLPGMSRERSFIILVDSLRELLLYARARGVLLALEYEPGLLVETAQDLAYLIERVDSPFFGANLDLGHSHVIGEDLCEVLQILNGRVYHIHLEDIKERRHYHLVPGDGDMNLPEIISSLCKYGYQGFVTVELYTYVDAPEEAATRSLGFIRDLGKREETKHHADHRATYSYGGQDRG